MIDWTSDSTLFFVYFGTNYYRKNFRRQTFLKTTGIHQSTAYLHTTLSKQGSASFVSVAAMNRAAQSEFVVAVGTTEFNTNQIARTTDRGTSFTTFNTGHISSISAMFYSFDGTTLYVAAGNNGRVARCSTGGALICAQVGMIARYVNHLAVDPRNSNVVFAATIASESRYNSTGFYTSTDGGASWVNGAVPGSLLATAAVGGAVTFINSALANTVVVGTSNGVLIPDTGAGGWKQLATGLPKVAVLDMLYEPADDTLVLATLGRGVWFLRQASAAASGAPLEFVQEEPPLNDIPLQDLSAVTSSVLVPPDDYDSGFEGDAVFPEAG
jgi:hypothetical protein